MHQNHMKDLLKQASPESTLRTSHWCRAIIVFAIIIQKVLTMNILGSSLRDFDSFIKILNFPLDYASDTGLCTQKHNCRD